MNRLAAVPLLVLLCSAPAAIAAQPPDDEAFEAEEDPSTIPTSPRAVVEAFHGVLLGCMKEADVLGFEGRYQRILAGLDASFDLPFMARASVGSTWKELDDRQRSDFVQQSRRYSAANYASNFTGYGGETFVTISDEPAARGTIVVKTQLVQLEDDDVQFDYRLREAGSRWRIIDVQLDGKVSEITLRRADYRSVIKRKGFDQLVSDIEKKIEKFSNE